MTATPFFKNIDRTFSVSGNSQSEVTFQALDLDGNPVDISSGYSAAIQAGSASNQNPWLAHKDMSSYVTFVYGSDGTLKVKFQNNFARNLPGQQCRYYLAVSSDSFSTISAIASGACSIPQEPVG